MKSLEKQVIDHISKGLPQYMGLFQGVPDWRPGDSKDQQIMTLTHAGTIMSEALDFVQTTFDAYDMAVEEGSDSIFEAGSPPDLELRKEQ